MRLTLLVAGCAALAFATAAQADQQHVFAAKFTQVSPSVILMGEPAKVEEVVAETVEVTPVASQSLEDILGPRPLAADAAPAFPDNRMVKEAASFRMDADEMAQEMGQDVTDAAKDVEAAGNDVAAVAEDAVAEVDGNGLRTGN